MNSITYIGSRVDSFIAHKPEEHPVEYQEKEKFSVWHIILSVFLLRWGHVVMILSTPKQQQPGKTPAEKINTTETSSKSPSQPTSALDQAAATPKRKRRKRDSIDLLRRPLIHRSSRKTLVLDLDETLIHSMSRSTRLNGSHMVEVELGKLSCIYFVEKRPFCDYFLNTVGQWYNLVVFTASVKSYADPMIDWVDQGRNYFSRRLYRDNCISTPTGFVKDLSILEEDLGQVILVDNSPVSFNKQRDNGVGIQGWISDPSDSCLLHLLPLLNALRYASDVRSLLCLQRGELFSSGERQFNEEVVDWVQGRERSDSMSGSE